MDKNKEIPAQLNDDNLIKLGHKRTGTLKKLFQKVIDGTATVVSHVPGAKFFVPKVLEKIIEREQQVNEPEKEPELQTPDASLTSEPVLGIQESVKTDESESATPTQEPEKEVETPSKSVPTTTIFGNPVSVEPKPVAEPTVTEDNKDSEMVTRHIKTIFPTIHVSSKQKTEATPKTKLAPIKTEETTVPTSTPIDLNINMSNHDGGQNNVSKASEEKETKVSDNDHLKESRKQYGDLIKFNTWQEYFHSFSKEEVEKKNEDGTMLKGTDFASIRLDQAETIKRITQAEEAERQTTISRLKAEMEERTAKAKENSDKVKELREEITRRNKETAELNAENKKSRSQVNSLNTESKEANTKIDEMDDIIGQLTNPDYQPKKKTEPKKVDSKTLAARKKVEEITKELEKELEEKKADTKKKSEKAKASAKEEVARAKKEGAKAKNTSKQVEDETPKDKTTTATNTIIPKVFNLPDQEVSLTDELADFDSEQVKTPKTESVVLESTNPDLPGTFTVNNDGTLTANWKNSPMTNEDFNMGFDNDTRAKIGQEAHEKFKNSNGSLSFDDAKAQVTEQYTQSKGRTR